MENVQDTSDSNQILTNQTQSSSAPLGTTPNFELQHLARLSLHGTWGTAVGFTFIILVFALLGAIPLVGYVISLILSGPLALGATNFYLTLIRTKNPRVEQVFSGFNQFGTAFLSSVFTSLFILLWTLLLIVPGIIAALSYTMTFFIIADNPAIGSLDAITASKKMMNGHKWKLFCLYWRFFGWYLLCIISFGIGFLWLVPYLGTSVAKFYEDIKPPKAL